MTTSLDASGLLDAFRRARNAGVPILGIDTVDQPYTCTALVAGVTGAKKSDPIPPAMTWDVVRGLQPLNDAATAWLARLTKAPALPKPGQPAGPAVNLAKTVDLAFALDLAVHGVSTDTGLPEGGCLFVFNAHRMLEGDSARTVTCVQAVMNCREHLKERGATLVLLSPGMRLPSELTQDVVTLAEALPGETKIQSIIAECYEQAGLKDAVPAPLMSKATDATLGLSAFAIEQIVAMSLTKNGVDTEALWDRKITMIEQTDGLSVHRGKEMFANLHGCAGASEFVDSLAAFWNPRAVMWLDEIEKAIAGYRGDNTGVSQDAMGTLLSWTEDRDVVGLLLMGGPGTGKSQFAKCCGTLLGAPTIKFDMGGMQAPEVGSSQRLIRTGLKVVDAVGQGRVLMVATCNGIDVLPPELRRRFRYGLYYFDLPDTKALAAIWATYRGIYGIAENDPTPDHYNWTGAEVKACCEIAARTHQPLAWAARKIVSIYRSNPGLVEGLRKQAAESGFIDARTGDPYALPATARPDLATALPGLTGKRNIKLES